MLPTSLCYTYKWRKPYCTPACTVLMWRKPYCTAVCIILMLRKPYCQPAYIILMWRKPYCQTACIILVHKESHVDRQCVVFRSVPNKSVYILNLPEQSAFVSYLPSKSVCIFQLPVYCWHLCAREATIVSLSLPTNARTLLMECPFNIYEGPWTGSELLGKEPGLSKRGGIEIETNILICIQQNKHISGDISIFFCNLPFLGNDMVTGQWRIAQRYRLTSLGFVSYSINSTHTTPVELWLSLTLLVPQNLCVTSPQNESFSFLSPPPK